MPVASAGVTLWELAMWWRRLGSPGIVKDGKQEASCSCFGVSGGRRASSGGRGYYYMGQSWKYFERTPCDLEDLVPETD
jgi:hypothetical protein